jgi:hypothetical protein
MRFTTRRSSMSIDTPSFSQLSFVRRSSTTHRIDLRNRLHVSGQCEEKEQYGQLTAVASKN